MSEIALTFEKALSHSACCASLSNLELNQKHLKKRGCLHLQFKGERFNRILALDQNHLKRAFLLSCSWHEWHHGMSVCIRLKEQGIFFRKAIWAIEWFQIAA